MARGSPWESFTQKPQPDPLVDGYDKVRAIIREQAAVQMRPAARYCRACEEVFAPKRADHNFCCGRCRDRFVKALRKHEGRCTACGGRRDDHCQTCSACREKSNRSRAEKRREETGRLQEDARRKGKNSRLDESIRKASREAGRESISRRLR